RARLWLLALAPMIVLVIYLIIAHHLNQNRLTFPIYVPLAMTFFLLMTTYATHERPRPGGFYRFLYRLFDLEAYLPWSYAHRRKTVLHGRIRDMVATIGSSHSLENIFRRLSEILQCPVVLMNREKLALQTGSTPEIVAFPRAVLSTIDRMVVAHEITRALPDLHVLMTRHKVAAIVPFHPRSRAANWMLLGEGFSEQVYTPVDFDEVKRLFDQLADHLLDEQMHMRAELNQARRETQELHRQIADAAQHLEIVNKQLAERDIARRKSPPTSAAEPTELDAAMQEIATNRKTLADFVADVERRMITDALERCGGNQSKAAEYLGIRPNTLHYKMQRYGLHNHNKSD
ncbi:MAG TPA: helix-turn-helix domain-containing protein, partial [Burkholderiales bacterium]